MCHHIYYIDCCEKHRGQADILHSEIDYCSEALGSDENAPLDNESKDNTSRGEISEDEVPKNEALEPCGGRNSTIEIFWPDTEYCVRCIGRESQPKESSTLGMYVEVEYELQKILVPKLLTRKFFSRKRTLQQVDIEKALSTAHEGSAFYQKIGKLLLAKRGTNAIFIEDTEDQDWTKAVGESFEDDGGCFSEVI